MNGDWRDDDIDLLKRLWAAGETAASIAAKLGGLSRSAVLGQDFPAAARSGRRQRQEGGGDESEPAPQPAAAPRRAPTAAGAKVATARRCSI